MILVHVDALVMMQDVLQLYQTNRISYSQIYGKVHACYSGSPDGFQYYGGHKNNPTLEDNYVEQCYQSLACNLSQLWDGGQCVGGATFYRQLPQPTTDNIEMRVCRGQDQNDEDILITFVEIFVQ